MRKSSPFLALVTCLWLTSPTLGDESPATSVDRDGLAARIVEALGNPPQGADLPRARQLMVMYGIRFDEPGRSHPLISAALARWPPAKPPESRRGSLQAEAAYLIAREIAALQGNSDLARQILRQESDAFRTRMATLRRRGAVFCGHVSMDFHEFQLWILWDALFLDDPQKLANALYHSGFLDMTDGAKRERCLDGGPAYLLAAAAAAHAGYSYRAAKLLDQAQYALDCTLARLAHARGGVDFEAYRAAIAALAARLRKQCLGCEYLINPNDAAEK